MPWIIYIQRDIALPFHTMHLKIMIFFNAGYKKTIYISSSWASAERHGEVFTLNSFVFTKKSTLLTFGYIVINTLQGAKPPRYCCELYRIDSRD